MHGLVGLLNIETALIIIAVSQKLFFTIILCTKQDYILNSYGMNLVICLLKYFPLFI